MHVMGDELTWCGVPMRMASVLLLFNWRKLSLIHAFISSRQMVIVDEVDGDGDDNGTARREGRVGSSFM